MVPLNQNAGNEKGPDTHAEAFRQMLAQHMLALRGSEGPMGLTGLFNLINFEFDNSKLF